MNISNRKLDGLRKFVVCINGSLNPVCYIVLYERNTICLQQQRIYEPNTFIISAGYEVGCLLKKHNHLIGVMTENTFSPNFVHLLSDRFPDVRVVVAKTHVESMATEVQELLPSYVHIRHLPRHGGALPGGYS